MISVLLGIAVTIVRMVGVVKGVCLRCHKHHGSFVPEVLFSQPTSQLISTEYSISIGHDSMLKFISPNLVSATKDTAVPWAKLKHPDHAVRRTQVTNAHQMPAVYCVEPHTDKLPHS